jgi:PAS domain S-box-containing protein
MLKQKIKLILFAFLLTASCAFAITDVLFQNTTWGEEVFADERYYKIMFERSPIPQAIVSKEGKWLAVNNSLCNLVGFTETELLLKTFQDITHPADVDIARDMSNKIINGYIQQYSMKKRYIGKWSTIVYVTIHVQGVYDEKGDFSHFYSIVSPRDIDEKSDVIVTGEAALPKTNKVKELIFTEWRILIPWAIILYAFIVKFGVEWRTMVRKVLKPSDD